MKIARILVTLLLAGVAATMFSGCNDEPNYIEGSQTRVMQQTVYRNGWNDDGSNYLWTSYDWDAITADVLQYGTVVAYVYEGTRQCPLPHVFPITYTLDDGSLYTIGENLRFDVEPGRITFIMQDLDGMLPDNIQTDITFRVVATLPTRYILPE